MQIIDPELLRNAADSPHRSALEDGYRWLRFAPALEKQFQDFHAETHLGRVRLAGYVTICMFALFIAIDIATLPGHVAVRTASIRGGLIIPISMLVLALTYRDAWRIHVAKGVVAAATVTGLSTVAIIATALNYGVQIPYEGILLVALFIYLIAGLMWWHAVVINALMLVVFVIMECIFQTDAQARLYQIVFMCAANVVGAYGGYFLERSIRTTFLVNTLLNDLAALDGLTGLANRRTLNIHVERVWRQALRDSKTVAIAMIDIDYFKRYNDYYGHTPGDAALKAVAAAIALEGRRPLDLVARYGGEEFAIVWYDPAPEELARMGAAINLAVSALGIAHQDSPFGSVSVSVGIARMAPTAGDASATLLRTADDALYQAKEAGRHCSVVVGAS